MPVGNANIETTTNETSSDTASIEATGATTSSSVSQPLLETDYAASAISNETKVGGPILPKANNASFPSKIHSGLKEVVKGVKLMTLLVGEQLNDTSNANNHETLSTEVSSFSSTEDSQVTSLIKQKASLKSSTLSSIEAVTVEAQTRTETVGTTSEKSTIIHSESESIPMVEKTTTTVSTISSTTNSESTTASKTPKNMLSASLLPRILLPFEETNVTNVPFGSNGSIVLSESEVEELEPYVPIEILSGRGWTQSENAYFPEHGAGEFVMMYVGPRYQKRPLYAVTRARDSIIKGNHNIIEIYNDIFEGSIYQYLHATDPSNLATLQFRDETLFAFIESRSEIHVYIYRGVQGFVGFKRIKLPGYASRMTSLVLPPKLNYKCDRHYLVVKMETEILFFGVTISGNCGVSGVRCN